jgi:UDP-N-acetylmuramate dehydrogenase
MSSARAPEFVAALKAGVRGEVREGESLSRYSTYRIGGPATVLLPQGGEDVAAALRLTAERGIPWFAVGLGSNLLFPDEGLDALVIRIGKGLDRLEREGLRWRIGAGMPGPLAARKTVAEGQGGLQKFVGIPGSVGGGIYMNAGAHGGDWSELVESVTVIGADGSDRVLPRAAVPFAYRRSGLGHVVVVETAVQLREEDPVALKGPRSTSPAAAASSRTPGGRAGGSGKDRRPPAS